MTKYTGGCHCGQVSFEVEADLTKVIECNCSHCAMKSLLLTFVQPEHFRLLSGEANLTEYRFNKKVIQHLFCNSCGVQPFSRGQDAEGKASIALNVRTLNDIAVDTLTLTPVDGKSW